MNTVLDQSIFDKLGEAAKAAWNEGELDALDGFLAPDYDYHAPPLMHFTSLEEYKQYVADVRAAYPDIEVDYEGSVVQGDISVVWGWIRGTNTGTSPSTGAPPTGREINFKWCQVARWEGDKAVEAWSYNDHLTMMQQLGVVQLPEPA